MNRLVAVLAAVTLAALPQTVAGRTEADIRWVDRTGASSDCIGAASSAVCAVETALACRVRRDAALCKAAGLPPPRGDELPFTRRNPDPFGVVEATGAKYLLHDEGEGDNRRIGLSVRIHGKYGLNWPEEGWRRLVYRVRREGEAGSWRVEKVSWQLWVRMVGPRDATGKCVGRRDTPACAVATHIACRVRDDVALCADAGGLEPRHFRPKGATVLFTIDRIRKWAPPDAARSGNLSVVVWVFESTDPPRPPGASDAGSAYIVRPSFVAVSYTLERAHGQWRVVNRTERP